MSERQDRRRARGPPGRRCAMNERNWRRQWPADDRTQLMDQRCGEYESAWRALRAPRIEDYLAGLDDQTRVRLWLKLVRIDHDLRRSHGETTTLADYRASCPDPVLILNVSTARIDPKVDGAPEAVEQDGTRSLAAEFGPIADRLGAFWKVDLRGPAADPSLATEVLDRPGRGTDRAARHRRAAPRGSARGPRWPGARAAGHLVRRLRAARELGAGGMGVVFKARQKRLNRMVALKMIKTGILADERDIRLFRTRGRGGRRAGPPPHRPGAGQRRAPGHALLQHEAGSRARTWAGAWAGSGTEPAAIARLMARVAEAIAHAHGAASCTATSSRRTSWSTRAASRTSSTSAWPSGWSGGRRDARRQPDGGTPSYMSPEQARGDRDAITDGDRRLRPGRRLLYTLLTGQPPFSGALDPEVIHPAGHPRGAAAAPRPESPGGPRPGDDLPEVPEQGAEGPVRLGPRAGRRPEPLARRPADPGAARLAGRAARSSGCAAIRGLVAGRRALAARRDRRRSSGVAPGPRAWGMGGWSCRRRRGPGLAGEDVARHLAYAATLNLAERDWRDANVGQVLRHLEETRPPRGQVRPARLRVVLPRPPLPLAGAGPRRAPGAPSRASPTAPTAAAWRPAS